MNKIPIAAVITLTTLILPNIASAFSVLYLNETFASGATYNGTITFTDNTYVQTLSTLGSLSGASYGHITLTQASEFNETLYPFNELPTDTVQIRDGSTSYDYKYFDTVTFNKTTLSLTPYTRGNTVDQYTNAINYADVMVSGILSTTPNAVPVPTAVWLFGSALASFIGFNRRKPML